VVKEWHDFCQRSPSSASQGEELASAALRCPTEESQEENQEGDARKMREIAGVVPEERDRGRMFR
jgi:hypothetical protein